MTYRVRKTQVQTTVTPDVLEKLEQDAFKHNRTLSSVVREVLTRYYNSPSKPYKLFDTYL